MNSIDIRTAKANAIFRYQHLTLLVRLVEICVFVVAISTFSPQVKSLSVNFNADYFKGITSFSPRFVFVIGNVIVIILLLKSRVIDNGDQYKQIDVYDEYVKRCESRQSDGRIRRKLMKPVADCGGESPEVRRNSEKVIDGGEIRRKLMRSVNDCGGESPEVLRSSEKVIDGGEIRRKLTRSVTERGLLNNARPPEYYRSQSEKMMTAECDGQIRRNLMRSVTDCVGDTPSPEFYWSQSEIMKLESYDGEIRRKLTRSVTERGISSTAPSPENKMTRRSVIKRGILKNLPSPEISRSQSEKIMKVECDDQSRRKLRRSVTDCRGGETPASEICGVDELSSEAFRRTVEAFIAKQQQSLREEELAPVPVTDPENFLIENENFLS